MTLEITWGNVLLLGGVLALLILLITKTDDPKGKIIGVGATIMGVFFGTRLSKPKIVKVERTMPPPTPTLRETSEPESSLYDEIALDMQEEYPELHMPSESLRDELAKFRKRQRLLDGDTGDVQD